MKADRISLDTLSRMSEDVPWSAFEAMQDGVLLLKDQAQTVLPEEEELDTREWVFVMRVGVHLGRSTQAIMSCGHFIRLRKDDRWEGWPLNVLDPSNPDGCIYYNYNTTVNIRGWCPQRSYEGTTYATSLPVTWPGATSMPSPPQWPFYGQHVSMQQQAQYQLPQQISQQSITGGNVPSQTAYQSIRNYLGSFKI